MSIMPMLGHKIVVTIEYSTEAYVLIGNIQRLLVLHRFKSTGPVSFDPDDEVCCRLP